MSGLKIFGYRIPKKQVIGCMVFWLIVATVLWTTRHMPMFDEGAPGPRFMPVVLATLFSILNVFYWIEAATKEEGDEPADQERNFRRPAAFFGIAVVLALCWESVGAVLTVFVCALVELRFIEHFSWLRTFITAAIISIVMLLLFQIVLGVALPGGLFESLSYLRL